jgi:hypothetical protein
MAAIVWNQIDTRKFETGIDRGVLYPPNECGVPWHGLTSVEEAAANTVEAVYFDGVKFNDLVTVGDFTGVLKAITYPDEFIEFEGALEDQTGVVVLNQPQGRFGLAYRTMIGNANGEMKDYKIHLLWNLTALPSTKVYETISDEIGLTDFEWSITAVPEDIENFRPTAHIILDSRKLDPWLLQDIEDIIYGDEDACPTLPSLKGLTTFIRKWDRLIITDHGDGTWTASCPRDGVIEMIDETTFKITTDTAEYITPDQYRIWSSEKNEEDIDG